MKKMYEKVLEVIKNSSYEIFGIRHIASDESYKVGDYARNSYDWDIEMMCHHMRQIPEN